MNTFTTVLIIIGLIILGLIILLEVSRRKYQKEERSWLDIKNESNGDPLETEDDEHHTETIESITDAQEQYEEAEEYDEIYIDDDDQEIIETSSEPELVEEVSDKTKATSPAKNLSTENQEEFDFELEPSEEPSAITEAVKEEIYLEPKPEPEFISEHEEVFVLAVMAKSEDRFEGADIIREFNSLNLKHGADNLYHRPMPGLKNVNLFSIANIMKPGSFDPKKILDLKTKGLLMFMRLPGRLEPVQAFDQFYDAAYALAVTLGGQVCDENRNRINKHRLEQMRDKIRHLELKLELERKKANKP